MSDKELADKVVALGVGRVEGDYYVAPQEYMNFEEALMDEPLIYFSQFVRDWRVAGALMEKCRKRGYTIGMAVVGATDIEVEVCEYDAQLREHNQLGIGQNESLPRAIIEACVEALDMGGAVVDPTEIEWRPFS